MDTLNYCSHAIECLSKSAMDFSGTRPLTARNILKIIGLLKQAVKFYLPDNGKLFEDGFRALPATFRLPYPVVAAEFRIMNEAPLNQLPLAMQGRVVSASSKRIALAVEINADNFHEFSWMLPSARYDILTAGSSVAIIPVFFLDDGRYWAIPPFGAAVPARKTKWHPEDKDFIKSVYGGDVPKGVKRVPFEFYKTYLMPEDAEIYGEQGTNYVLSMTLQDNVDEIMAVLQMIEVLSCKNVSTGILPPPKAANKKREAKGKTPFFEYRVLMLDPASKAGGAAGAGLGGTHASPRMHLRRGHIRRLPDKAVWVNSTVVGNGKTGMVMKDYSLKSPGPEQ